MTNHKLKNNYLISKSIKMNQFRILTKSQMSTISGGKNIWYWIGYVFGATAGSHAKTLENLGTDACNAAVMYN